jgi:hypothetical protein
MVSATALAGSGADVWAKEPEARAPNEAQITVATIARRVGMLVAGILRREGDDFMVGVEC